MKGRIAPVGIDMEAEEAEELEDNEEEQEQEEDVEYENEDNELNDANKYQQGQRKKRRYSSSGDVVPMLPMENKQIVKKYLYDNVGDIDFMTLGCESKEYKRSSRGVPETRFYMTAVRDMNWRLVFFTVDGGYGARHFLAVYKNQVRMFVKDFVKRGMRDLNDDGEHKVVIHNHEVEAGRLNDSLQEFHPVILKEHCPYILPRDELCVYGFFCQDWPDDPTVSTLQDTYNDIAKYMEGRVNRDGPILHGRHQVSVFKVVHSPPFLLDEPERVVALRALLEMKYIPRLQRDIDYKGPIGKTALQMADMYSLGLADDPVLSVSQSTVAATASGSGVSGAPMMSSSGIRVSTRATGSGSGVSGAPVMSSIGERVSSTVRGSGADVSGAPVMSSSSAKGSSGRGGKGKKG